MKKLLLFLSMLGSYAAAAQTSTVVDTAAIEAHAAEARYKLIGQGATPLPGDPDYFEAAKKDYDQLIAWGRTKNLLYRAGIVKIKTQGMSFDVEKNKANLALAKQGLEDLLAYEKRYGASAESTRYREGLERNIRSLER